MTLHPQCLAVVDLQAAIVNPVKHHRPFGHRIENRREVARRGSSLTPRWRETDSNLRSPQENSARLRRGSPPFSRRNGTCKAVSKDTECRRQKSVRI